MYHIRHRFENNWNSVLKLLMSLGAVIDYKSASFMALNGHYDDF